MKKNLWWKDLFCVYLTQNVSKNNFGLKFVQTNFSVFKIDNFKNTKIILGYLKLPSVSALDGSRPIKTKSSHHELSTLQFLLFVELGKVDNFKTLKDFTSLFIMKKNLWWKRLSRVGKVDLKLRTFPKIILVWNLFKQISVFSKNWQF